MSEAEKGEVDFSPVSASMYHVNLSLGELEIIKKISGVKNVTKEIVHDTTGSVYPYEPSLFKWSVDNFGGNGLWVPKKGAKIDLTKPENIALYKRVIKVYENNEWGGKRRKGFHQR